MSSLFDPNEFLHATTTEAATRRPLIPTENPADPNGLYDAVIGDVTMASGIIGKGDRAGQPWVQAVIPLRVQLPPEVQALIGGQQELTITDRPMLDVVNKALDWSVGKNRGLRTYREATGLNVKGEPFSLTMLAGKMVKVKLSHEEYQGNFNEKLKSVFPG